MWRGLLAGLEAEVVEAILPDQTSKEPVPHPHPDPNPAKKASAPGGWKKVGVWVERGAGH